jgi:hypothetical protein
MRKYAPPFVENPTIPRLPSPFTRCPVCGGTTSMVDHYENGIRRICSVCFSCDTRWDLQGNCIHYGAVVRLPFVQNLILPEDEAGYNPAIKPVRKCRGVPSGAPAFHPVIASEAKQSDRNY